MREEAATPTARQVAARKRWAARSPEERRAHMKKMSEKAHSERTADSYSQRHHSHGEGVSNGSTVALVFRSDPETFAAVRAIAVRRGVSVAQVVREFVEWGLENDY